MCIGLRSSNEHVPQVQERRKMQPLNLDLCKRLKALGAPQEGMHFRWGEFRPTFWQGDSPRLMCIEKMWSADSGISSIDFFAAYTAYEALDWLETLGWTWLKYNSGWKGNNHAVHGSCITDSPESLVEAISRWEGEGRPNEVDRHAF